MELMRVFDLHRVSWPRLLATALAALLLACAAALPLTATGFGSATASADLLSLAWDSGRGDLKLAAFVGLALLVVTVPMVPMAAIDTRGASRAWMVLATSVVLGAVATLVLMWSNLGAAPLVVIGAASALALGAAVDRRARRSGELEPTQRSEPTGGDG